MKTPLSGSIRLRFPGGLEQEFLEDYFQKSLTQLRFGIVLGGILYALFGILDAWIFPAVKEQTWFIRYAVISPACVGLLLFTYSRHFKKHMQAAIFFIVVLAGLGIIAMMVIVRSPINYFHYAGLLLILMYSYTFSRLRFVYTSVASWLLVACYEVVALRVIHTPFPVLLNDNFFYIAANLIGMFSSYHRELYTRKDFLQTGMVKELEEKKHQLEKENLKKAVDKATTSQQASEARFLALAQSAAAAIFILQGSKFLYVNPAGEAISGYAREEILNMDFWKLAHPDYREVIKERAGRRLSGAEPPGEYEFKIVRNDGEERWVNMTAGSIEFEGKPAIIGTLYDITDRKRAEEEKARLYEDNLRHCKVIIEEEKRHVAEKEKILRDLHDGLGGITTNISLLADLAQKAQTLEDVKRTLGTIAELSREGMSEIRSFMHSLDAREITWHTLIAELRRYGSSMVESHGMSFEIRTSVEDVQEQPGSLLCLNLFRIYKEAITNVAKHSKAKAVNVEVLVGDGKLALSVQDDGVGVGAGREGGRGMANMKTRAREMGAALNVESETGTRVSLELPLPQKYPAGIVELS